MLEIKNNATGWNNAIDHHLISRLDTAEERINELEYISLGTSQTERQRIKKKNQNSQNYGETFTKAITHA